MFPRPLQAPVRALTAALPLLVVSGWCWAADSWSGDDASCSHQDTTYAIAACLDSRSKVWDQRLNQAYQAMLTMLADQPSRVTALKTAQRAWVAYRNANCAFYETEEGTIRMVAVAACMRDMTQARAIELQENGPH